LEALVGKMIACFGQLIAEANRNIKER